MLAYPTPNPSPGCSSQPHELWLLSMFRSSGPVSSSRFCNFRPLPRVGRPLPRVGILRIKSTLPSLGVDLMRGGAAVVGAQITGLLAQASQAGLESAHQTQE